MINQKKYNLFNISFILFFLLSLFSCSNKIPKTKENEFVKNEFSVTATINKNSDLFNVINSNTNTIVTYPDLYERQHYSFEVLQTIQANTIIKIYPNRILPLSDNYIYISTNNFKGWVSIRNINIDLDTREELVNEFNSISKDLKQYQKDILINFISYQYEKITPDFLSALIENLYIHNNQKIYTDEVRLIIKLFSLCSYDETSETNPFVRLIKYTNLKDSTLLKLNENIFSAFFVQPDNKENTTPLIQAIRKENIAVTKMLIKQEDYNFDYKDSLGRTATDWINLSSNVYLKEIFHGGLTNIDLYVNFIKKLAEEQKYDLPQKLYFSIPVTYYYRNSILNKPITANNSDEFINKLEVQEEYEEYIKQKDQNSNNASENNIFPFDAFVTTEDDSAIQLLCEPNKDAKEIIKIPNNSKIKIINIYDTPEELFNAYDYWYKIKYQNYEGWCFGGFLYSRIICINSEFIKQNKIFMQKNLSHTVYAIKNTKLYILNDLPVDIPAGDSVSIIDISNENFKYGEGIFYYYLVQYQNKIGIICGEDFANDKLFDENNIIYCSQEFSDSDYRAAFNLYKIDILNNKSEKIQFCSYNDNDNPFTMNTDDYYFTYYYERNYLVHNSLKFFGKSIINSEEYDFAILDLPFSHCFNNRKYLFLYLKNDKAIIANDCYCYVYTDKGDTGYTEIKVNELENNQTEILINNYGNRFIYNEILDKDRYEDWYKINTYKTNLDNPLILDLVDEKESNYSLE